jgi:hypothetical protein
MFQRAVTMKHHWHTAWHGQDIVVYRDDTEVDRLRASDIRRVIFVQDGPGFSAGDLAFAVVEFDTEHVVLPADTGFAGLVNFERQAFWAAKDCIYWAEHRHAPLPPSCRRGFLHRTPQFVRLPQAELAPLIERWRIEGPQTWDQRRWQRIENERPFGPSSWPPREHAHSSARGDL